MASTTAVSTQRAASSFVQSSGSALQKLAKPPSSAIAAPSTPGSKPPAAESHNTPSPGRWRHPTFDLVTERRKRTTFDESNVRTVILNATALLAAWWWPGFLAVLPSSVHAAIVEPLSNLTDSWPYIWLAICSLLSFNIFRALRPLFLSPDNITDIDLNARQRSLFGLDPKATPPQTAKTRYITPPKYPTRSASSTPGSNGSNNNYNSTPGSTPSRPAHTLLRHASDSTSNNPISTSNTGSPLWKRAVEERRSSLSAFGKSYNNNSPLGGTPPPPDTYTSLLDRGGSPSASANSWRFVPKRSSSMTRRTPTRAEAGGAGARNTTPPSGSLGGSVFAPNTPSPVGRAASVPLNSRWLYERSRSGGSPGYS